MPAPRSSSSSSRASAAGGRRSSRGGSASSSAPASLAARTARATGVGDGIASVLEQLINRVLRPLDLVLISRERIQETLDEAAARGRVTRSDANALVVELVQRGRQQTEDVLGQIDGLWHRRRESAETGSEPGVLDAPGGIGDYDELTARQVIEQLRDLEPPDLRAVRDHERRHLNRKSVLDAVERALQRS